MPIAHYVTAKRSGDRLLPLLGPFKQPRAAWAMLWVVRRAVERYRPDLADCSITVDRVQVPKGRKLPRGRLDLTVCVDEDWIEGCLSSRYDKQ